MGGVELRLVPQGTASEEKPKLPVIRMLEEVFPESFQQKGSYSSGLYDAIGRAMTSQEPIVQAMASQEVGKRLTAQDFVELKLIAGYIALAEGDSTVAARVFSSIGGDSMARRWTAELCLERGGNHYEGLRIARDLCDDALLRKGAEVVADDAESCLDEVVSQKLDNRIRNSYGALMEQRFRLKHSSLPEGSEKVRCSDRIYEMINAGSVLSAQYDVCVGVVPSGTFPAHVFSLFGLKTLFAVPRTYRPNRRVIGYVRRLDEVAWVGEGDEKFEDKRVLMVDDGIATDQTHREIVSLIETRMPQYIDFFVMRAPPEFRLPPQTKRESEVSGSVREKYLAAGVPRVVRKVLSPDMLSYRGFYDAIVTLEKKLGIRE